MSILRLSGVTREVGTFVILDSIDASIALGDRIGLVGPNGAGKTTLLRLAAGRDEPDRGEVHRKRGLTLGLLAQEAHFDAVFMASPDLRTAVRTGAAHLDRMAERLAALRARRPGDRAGLRRAPARVRGPRRLHPRPARRHGADRARLHPRRVGQAAVGPVGRRADAGVAGPPGHRRPGPAAARRTDEPPRPRRARVARGAPPPTRRLAAGRVARPGLPRRDGDPGLGAARSPADGVPRRLHRLPPPARGTRRADGQGRRDAGRGDRPRAGARPALPEPPQVQQDARARGAARAPRGRASRGAARPAAGWPSRPTALVGSGPSRSGEIVVRVEDLAVGYLPGRGAVDADGPPAAGAAPGGARARSSRPSAASGSGSSGRTAPARRRCSGRSPATCRRSTGRSPSATPSRSATSPSCATRRSPARPCSTRCSRRSRSPPGEARSYLARFLFRGDDAFKEVRSLSGGERSRLELALLGIQASNLLLLDEPTNHLDIPAREAIEAFMATSPATLLVVSHDRRLLETVCEKLWVVDRGRRCRSTAAIAPGGRRSPAAGRWPARWRWRPRGCAAGAGARRRSPLARERATGGRRRRRRSSGARIRRR